jgi:Zn-dependent protease with chaperone function
VTTSLPDPDTTRAAASEEGAERASTVRLALLILEGYLYLAVVAGVFVGAIVFLAWGLLTRRPLIALVAIAIGVPLVVITASTIRSLLFRLPEPDGIPVTANDAPALHAVVNELARQLDARPVHHILIDARCNASALQVPRAGPFWPRNTLLLGYPLFAMISGDQLRAVIAHEVSHFSRGHGRMSAWAYRSRLSWTRLMQTLDARGATPAHAYWLFRWYAPRLRRLSSAIALQHEADADRCAVAVVGSKSTAEALVALEVGASLLEPTFWRAVFDRVEHEQEPPRPFAAMGRQLWDAVASSAEGTLERLLEDTNSPDDTHPCLSERLHAIGEQARLPAIDGPRAGEAYLGPHMRVVAAALDAQWLAVHAEEWRRRHHEVQTDRRHLDELAARERLTPDELFTRGQLIERLDGPDDALPHYRNALAQGHAGAMLAAGRILLDQNDENGVALIERSMDTDPTLVREGCERLIPFLNSRNRPADAYRHSVRLTQLATSEGMADAERRHLTVVDRFAPHGLGLPAVSAIVARLEGEPAVLQAFMVKKELRYSANEQLVLALTASGSAADRLPDRIREEGVLATATIVVLERHDEALVAALEAIAGARVYARA